MAEIRDETIRAYSGIRWSVSDEELLLELKREDLSWVQFVKEFQKRANCPRSIASIRRKYQNLLQRMNRIAEEDEEEEKEKDEDDLEEQVDENQQQPLPQENKESPVLPEVNDTDSDGGVPISDMPHSNQLENSHIGVPWMEDDIVERDLAQEIQLSELGEAFNYEWVFQLIDEMGTDG